MNFFSWKCLGWVLLLAVLIIAPIGRGGYIISVLSLWLVYSIAAMGLNLTLGYAGQISLAQASFMAIGAYVSALLSMAGWPWLTTVPFSLLAAFVVGILLGYPALRVQGHYLAFVTLAFNTLVFLVLRNEDWLTGGIYGLSGMPRPNFSLFGFTLFDATQNLHFYYFILLLTVISALALWGIVRSPWGRAFKALRENPIRAESLGLDTRRITLLAFAIGSAYGGLSGAIMSPLVQFIDPASFTFAQSLRILLMVVVGGIGSFFGPFLGAAMAIILPEFMRFTDKYYLIIYALAVIIVLIFSPKGLWGMVENAGARIATWRKARATS